MKLSNKFLLMALLSVPVYGSAEELILDDFEYADDFEIIEMYSNSGWLGTGEAYITTESKDGTTAMELLLSYDGGAWGGAAVVSAPQEPFAFKEGQMITLDIKGDPSTLSGDQTILVFQMRDAAGEVIRFLDFAGPKAANWVTIKMPYKAFQEGPYDANPSVPADRENLVTWEFYIQGVGGDVVDPFEATVYIDNLKITDAQTASEGDRVLDAFDYASDTEIASNYVKSGWTGLGTPSVSTDKVMGTSAMKLSLTYEGAIWGSAGVVGIPQDPFSLKSNQKISYYVKGDPANMTSADALIVLQFKDSSGEIMRYLDAVGPKTAEWTQIDIPYAAFEESPWDANPETPADRNSLVSWEFNVQGVGGEPVSPFAAVLLIDQLEISTVQVDTEYKVNKISASQAPNVTDTTFDAIYASAGEEMSTWEDDTFSPVGAPYSETRAYLLTDGVTLYCGMILGDPDTSTLKTDTANDTLSKWNVDSWEIVFAPNAGQVDGQNYIKFAGDSIGQWDDISPDTAGGTDWNAPSFKASGYVIDADTWAAEFSVAIADIQEMFTGFDSYGHIGMQVKEPALNFAWPDRASFGSRNGHWDFSALDATEVNNWVLY